MTVDIGHDVNGGVRLRYHLSADFNHILMPVRQPAVFADDLWQHTCFEAFIGVKGEAAYHEFNFSPSGQWAAYAFAGYRERVAWTPVNFQPLRMVSPFEADTVMGNFWLEAIIEAANLPTNPESRPFEVGLSAVIETVNAKKYYWALAHPGEQPDFHLQKSFIASV